MSRVELRLLGGFDARLDGRDLNGFESQKSRALLAYLALNRQRPVERRLLAGLFWSERSEVSARRNLRQALHNIRATTSSAADLPPLFTASRSTVQINPDVELWLDVEEFRNAVRIGLEESHLESANLSTAARLYTGDLMAGFAMKGCPTFDDWLRGEQERLRLAAVAAYQRLIDDALENGDYRLGIDYAHRLLTIDPTSEETHRQLMRLYSGSGRHSRALVQYKQLRELLERELGVEPMPETNELYEQLIEARESVPGDAPAAQPVGPALPLEGRAAELRRLRAQWQEARDGNGSLTLLVGDDGVGKTRLARSFLAQMAKQGDVTIRRTMLVPTEDDQPNQLVRRLLDGPTEPGKATALFVDDLQWASDEDQEALLQLSKRIHRQPVWVLACCRSGTDLSGFHFDDRIQHLSIDSLHARAIHGICNGLLNLAEAQRLSRFVATWSGGNPLAISEMINYLWDAGVLVSEPAGGWTLAGPLPSRPTDFESLIRRRLRHLPTSARRLLVLAALIGPRFDRTALADVGDEHPAVVDACLEVLLDRWMIRWADPNWSPRRPGSDVDRWNRGHREGPFEFSHERVRWAVLSTLDARRARELRQQIKDFEESKRPPATDSGRSSSIRP